MSNSLAIATVTATLAALVQKSVEQAVGGADVVIGRPRDTNNNTQRWTHLYLYQVTPNSALRNADLPTRNSDGTVNKRPQVALDLHYLLAFYGDDKELESQRMLGAVARDLHASPVLLRPAIRDVVASWSGVLTGSNLDEAVEQIKLTPLPLSLEELSKLWSVFFQTPHAISMAYQASVVLIESEDAVSPIPPVLQRGKNDQGVEALLGAFPRLEKIYIGFAEDDESSARLPSLPNARLGVFLTFHGQHLGGDTVSLRFTHPHLGKLPDIDIPVTNRSDTTIRFEFPNDHQAQTDWAAGLYTVVAVIKQAETTKTTNQLSLPLAIKVNQIVPVNPVARINDNVTLTVNCSPKVLIDQRVLLLLGGIEVPAEPRLAVSDSLVFVIEKAPTLALESVYVRVDGVDSLPFERVDNPPRFVFADNQKVSIT